MQVDAPFKIGNCQVYPFEHSIQFDGEEKQSVQTKFIEVLCYLAKHAPRVISREELINDIWQGNEYVGEKALTNAIWHLRQSLKGANGENEVIETIRKVGYRLLITPTYSNQNTENAIANNSQHKFKYFILVALLSLVAITFFVMQTEQASIKATSIKQITKYPGVELFTAPSPDGKQVVFKWLGEQTNGNLFLRDRNNPQLPPQQLTYGSAYVGHSVWSNDGKFLYFSRKDRRNKICQFVQLQVETHQEKVITNCPTNGGYYYVDISPDDKTLAFHGYQAPADDSGIYFIDLTDDTSQPTRFSCSINCGYKDRDFSFSPDGKSIAVTRRVNRFNENIYLVNLETLQAEQLTFDEEDIVGLTWHPNGQKLVYGAQRADIRRGYVIDLTSKEITNLQLDGFSYPAFAKQSGELFYQQRTENYHLASLSLNSDIATTPYPILQSKFSHHYPQYSSKRNKIAYVSNESGFYELWLSDIDGQHRKQLTFLKQAIRYPRWSNSGDKIAFLAPVKNNKADKIYIYDLVSNTLSIVPSQHQAHNRPTWSWHDDAIISAVYESEYVDLHKIDIKTGKSTRITNSGSRYGIMTSPTTLLYTQEDKGLWQKEIASSALNTQPLLKISGKEFKVTYSWEYTEQGVYYRQRDNKHHVITFYDFNQQQSIPLLRIPKNLLDSNTTMSKIAASNELIFTMADSPQADIKSIVHSLLH